MTKDTGGPAFPVVIPLDQSAESHMGMTLRDYFAAKALQGLMGRDWSDFKVSDQELIAIWAQSAYGVADAMLKARQA